MPYEPQKLSQRLSIQQGEFLAPRNIEASFIENLNALGAPAGNVMKYWIPFSQRGPILERLRLMNITREQLFPGMDGFAQSFRQILFRETEEQKREREIRATLRAMLDPEVSRLVDKTALLVADEQTGTDSLTSGPATQAKLDDD